MATRRNRQAAESNADDPEIRRYGSAEEIAAEIAAQCDLVAIGCELLGKGGEAKGASVKLRMWESVMQRLYGEQVAAEEEVEPKKVNIVWSWDLPKREPEPESDAT